MVILDLGLPGISGIEVIRGLRGWSSVPIIILSAREAEADKIAQFRYGVLGLDLYGMRETRARLRVTYVDDPVGDDTPDVAADARAGQS